MGWMEVFDYIKENDGNLSESQVARKFERHLSSAIIFQGWVMWHAYLKEKERRKKAIAERKQQSLNKQKHNYNNHNTIAKQEGEPFMEKHSKINIDHQRKKATVDLEDRAPRVVLIGDGKAHPVELPSHGDITIKVHDGRIKTYSVTEGHLFQ